MISPFYGYPWPRSFIVVAVTVVTWRWTDPAVDFTIYGYVGCHAIYVTLPVPVALIWTRLIATRCGFPGGLRTTFCLPVSPVVITVTVDWLILDLRCYGPHITGAVLLTVAGPFTLPTRYVTLCGADYRF